MNQTCKETAVQYVRSVLRVVAMVALAAVLAIFLGGCEMSADSLIAHGDRYLAAGDQQKALRAYQEARKVDPNNQTARRKAQELQDSIDRENLEKLQMLLTSLFAWGALPTVVLLWLSRHPGGKKMLHRFRMLTGLYSWHEAKEVKKDFQQTVDFLMRKGVHSYLEPLADILREFLLMRDAYVRSRQRLQQLDRILAEDVTRLDEISGSVKDQAFRSEIKNSAGSYRRRIEQQKAEIIEFKEKFVEEKQHLCGFLINLRTRLDLDESFDGRHEIERLTHKLAGIRKTFQSAESTWS